MDLNLTVDVDSVEMNFHPKYAQEGGSINRDKTVITE